MKHALFCVVALLCLQQLFSQSPSVVPLQVGQPLPTVPMKYWKRDSVFSANTDAFKHQYVIIDFWDIWCKSCLQAMPKIELLQEQFQGKVQFILVTQNSKEEADELFRRVKVKRPSVPMIYADSVFHQLFLHAARPHYAILDTAGIVRFITYGYNIHAGTLNALVKGERLSLAYKQDLVGFDYTSSLLREGGGRLLPYIQGYRVFFKRIAGIGSRAGMYSRGDMKGLRIYNQPLLSLYKFAYGKKIINEFTDDKRVIIEAKDKTPFLTPSNAVQIDAWRETHLHGYESAIPVSSTMDPYDVLQDDLTRFYDFDVKIEKRMQKALVIESVPEKTIRMKGERRVNEQEKGSWLIRNGTAGTTLLPGLQKLFPDRLIIDRSGCTSSFDLDIRYVDEHMPSVLQALQKKGVSIRDSIIEIEMLVIRDKKKGERI
jgi:thiol-disulfide isomerase/thioredoxin